MFDAINTFEREFEPYRVRLRHTGGSAEAAAAQAAHDVLVAINPMANGDLRRRTRQPYRDPSVGLRPPRRRGRCDRRPRDPGLAPDRRLGGVAVPALLGTAPPGTLAEDAAGQREPGLHPSSVRRAAGAADVHAIPAASASVAGQRPLRRRSERGETDREIGQHDPHSRADRNCTTVGRHGSDRHGDGDQLSLGLEQHRPRLPPARAGCRSSRRRECSCSSTCRCTTAFRPPR